MRLVLQTGLSVLLVASLACSGSQKGPADAGPIDAGPSTVVLFRADAGGLSFAHPWPMDSDRDDGGHPRFDTLPRPRHSGIVDGIIALADGRFDGFATTGAVYFRLNADLDPASLPVSLADAAAAGSALQLIDIDPASSERGRRFPVQWTYQATASTYATEHTLAAASAPGFPLRATTRYAAVLTRAARDVDGGSIGPDAELAGILEGRPSSDWSWLTSSVAELATQGVPASAIAGLAVFTTQDPVSEFYRSVDTVAAMPPPTVSTIELLPGGPPYEFEGHFGPVPDFQLGSPPYSNPGDGDFAFDTSGAPLVQQTLQLRFVLTVPAGTAPGGGFPIALYAHGTGGDAASFVNDGTAGRLAAVGLAGLSFDQPFAGERAVAGTSTQLQGAQFYNFDNPVALRRNIQVAGLNMVSLGQLVGQLDIAASLAPGHEELRFNPAAIVSFTHSQGSEGGALWLAGSGQAQAALLSGAGGTPISALIQVTPENDTLALLAAVLGVPENDTADLGFLSPLFSLVRAFSDAASPVNYADAYFRHPRPGLAPRSVFVTMGLGDSYVTDREIGSLAVAASLPQANPVLQPFDPAEALGLPVVTLPIQANLAGGAATGAWQQASPPAGEDGHFVVFDDPDLAQRAVQFLAAGALARAPPLGP